MREAQINHSPSQRDAFSQRFEDMVEAAPDAVTSFFFDLKLLLPPGTTAQDVHRARLTVERRLDRSVRRKDRIVWTADGFFLALATTDTARAGAAAERIQQDVCAALAGGDTMPAPYRQPAEPFYTPPDQIAASGGKNHGSSKME